MPGLIGNGIEYIVILRVSISSLQNQPIIFMKVIFSLNLMMYSSYSSQEYESLYPIRLSLYILVKLFDIFQENIFHCPAISIYGKSPNNWKIQLELYLTYLFPLKVNQRRNDCCIYTG
jgi:hypothetical protein